MLVCLGAMRASLAFELRLGDAVFGGCIPTFLAAVRGVPGVDLNPDTPSIFRFGAQNRDEATPASVTDTSIESGLRPGTVGQKLPRVVFIGDGLCSPQPDDKHIRIERRRDSAQFGLRRTPFWQTTNAAQVRRALERLRG
jgi:hypothetical protein